MAGAGLGFVLTRNYILLYIAAIIGVISPAGTRSVHFYPLTGEPFRNLYRTKSGRYFAWYNLVGFVRTATGRADGGWLSQWVAKQWGGQSPRSYRLVLWGYAIGGFILLICSQSFTCHRSDRASDSTRRVLGLHRSRARWSSSSVRCSRSTPSQAA